MILILYYEINKGIVYRNKKIFLYKFWEDLKVESLTSWRIKFIVNKHLSKFVHEKIFLMDNKNKNEYRLEKGSRKEKERKAERNI